MYAQECYHYKRPDVSHVTWFTPQQLEAARLERSLSPVQVQVREIPPQKRNSPNENADTQNLIASAPAIFANAIRKGVARVHKEMPVAILNKGIKKFSLEHRRKLSLALKRSHALKASTLNP